MTALTAAALTLAPATLAPAVAPAAVAAAAGAPAAGAPAPPAPTSAPGPLLWTAPAGISAQPLDALACPSTSLCVAVDHGGDVVSSAAPTAGARTWHVAHVDGNIAITGVACPSVGLCVAVDAAGNVLASTTPTIPTSWTVAKVDTSPTQVNTDTGGSILLRGVACSTTTLCVAVDAAGNALVSTNPTAGAAGWVTYHADANTSFGCTGIGLTCQPALVGVACPAAAACAAVDFSGNILTTPNALAGAPWASTATAPAAPASLWGISCPTVAFCATVDGYRNHVITFDPASPAPAITALPTPVFGVWCQSGALCLAATETARSVSALLGSYDPRNAAPKWTLSSLGGVNAISCLGPTLCLAADDEGELAAGATTRSLKAALTGQALSTRHLPKTRALVNQDGYRLSFTAPIAARLEITWVASNLPGVTLASAEQRYAVSATKTLRLRLTAAGRRLLRQAKRRVSVVATATLTASTGVVTAQRKLRLPPPAPGRKRRR